MTTSNKVAPVLCFGDSLTEGYMGVWHHPINAPSRSDPSPDSWPQGELNALRLHPYSIHLGAMLAALSSPEDSAAGYKGSLRYAVVRAYSGWTAREMVRPLSEELFRGPWRACVLQAGANDIVAGVSASETLTHVLAMCDACDAAGVPVVLVPNTDADLEAHGLCQDGVKCRKELQMLAEMVEHEALKRGYAVAHARNEMPMDPSHSHLWDDCVHYSAEGAKLLAEVIYNAMRKHDL